MRRLFVDCDDTLVLWQKDGAPPEGAHPYGGGAESWLPNEALISAIRSHMTASPEDRLIIWTGGGVNYATMWADRLMPGEWHLATAKDPRLVQAGDVCVDDMPMKVAGELVSWQEFVSGNGVASTEQTSREPTDESRSLGPTEEAKG